jgi:hypothetical protein
MFMSMGEGQEPMKIEVGMFNTINAASSVVMPLVNAQLWQTLKISGMDVELAVEKARSSRLETVTQVKNAYFATLFAKEAAQVYNQVYENALKNFDETKKKYDAQKISEMELLRARTTVENSIPNVYNAESSVILALWQLKAVLGVDLDMNIDIAGELSDYATQMFYDIHQHDSVSLANNTTMKQLAIQAQHLVLSLGLGGEQDDGGIGDVPDPGGGGDAVHDGHHDVQQNQVDIIVLHHFQGFLAGKGFKQIVALGGKVDLQGVDDIRLVITDQNVVHGGSPPILSLWIYYSTIFFKIKEERFLRSA